MRLENTSDYTPEQFRAAFPDIVRCFRSYSQRFPHHGSPWAIIDVAADGKWHIFVVRDEEGEIIIAFTAAIQTRDTTQKRVLTMYALGGERLQEAIAVLPDLEAWARAQGAQEFELVGRKGWQRLIEPYGYEPEAIIYRKSDV
jgi:hypothetical protein